MKNHSLFTLTLLAITLNLLATSAFAGLIAINDLTYVEKSNGFQQGQIGRTDDRYGNTNGAFLFDGINDVISLTPDYFASSFTFALNVRLDERDQDGAHVFDLGAYRFLNNTGRIFLSLDDPDWFGLSRIRTNGASIDIEQNITMPFFSNSLWHHIALTFNAQNRQLKVYVEDTIIYDFATLLDGPDQWGILQTWELGRNLHDVIPSYFEGAMSHVFYDDRVLSDSEISYLAGGGVFPRTTQPADPNNVAEPPSIILIAASVLLLLLYRTKTFDLLRL